MIATSTRKGECPPGYRFAHVTFDEGRNEKLYAYWTPAHWDVQPGDKLRVIVSERSEYKTTTVRSIGGLMPMGAEHKIASGHVVMVRDRQLLAEMEAEHFKGYDDTLADFKVNPRDWPSLHEVIQWRITVPVRQHESLAVPARLMGQSLQNIPRTPKEPTKMIKMETYLNGKLLSAHSDDELFAVIRQTEAEIKGLMAIETKPKVLKDRMLKLQADIDALVKYMDAR